MFDYVCNVEHGTIVGWYCGFVGEEEVPSCSAACLWFTEIAGITVYR
jgi:hypothetical protein